jgi:hypothetical protein
MFSKKSEVQIVIWRGGCVMKLKILQSQSGVSEDVRNRR